MWYQRVLLQGKWWSQYLIHLSLGDGGTASCKLGKAQVGIGVVGGGREGSGALLGLVRGGSACSASALNKLH